MVRDPPLLRPSRRRSILFAFEALLLIASVTAAVLLSDAEQWQPPELVGLLAVLAWGSDFLTLGDQARAHLGRVPRARPQHGAARAGARGRDRPRLRDRRRAPLPHARHLAARATRRRTRSSRCSAAIVLQAIDDTGFAEHGGFAFSVFVVFCVMNVLNFTMVAGHIVLTRGGSLREMFVRVFLPVVPWELATGSMTAMAVYGFELYGTGVVGLFVLALGVCQLLLRSLLKGHEHGEEVLRRKDQLDVRHEGMVGLLLETLALRDPSAARHAAAVAHYSRQLARAAGLNEHGQAVAHTAGLLHDIGKEALPDHILLGRSELHAAERRLVERHPADGARLLLRVEGLGEVAHAVLAHHERIDGHGYPGRPRRARTSRSTRGSSRSPRSTTSSRRPTPTRSRCPPPRPRPSCARSPAASSTAGSCGCSSRRCCAAS